MLKPCQNLERPKGGKARAAKLPHRKRKAKAKKAAQTRWK